MRQREGDRDRERILMVDSSLTDNLHFSRATTNQAPNSLNTENSTLHRVLTSLSPNIITNCTCRSIYSLTPHESSLKLMWNHHLFHIRQTAYFLSSRGNAINKPQNTPTTSKTETMAQRKKLRVIGLQFPLLPLSQSRVNYWIEINEINLSFNSLGAFELLPPERKEGESELIALCDKGAFRVRDSNSQHQLPRALDALGYTEVLDKVSERAYSQASHSTIAIVPLSFFLRIISWNIEIPVLRACFYIF
jgi:hypothetical protein